MNTLDRLSPSAQRIYDAFLNTLQDAEELGGPEGADYLRLMRLIAREAHQREQNFLAANPQHRITVEQLAHAFARQLRDHLGEARLSHIDELNAGENESRPSVCHSHDFCDANQFLLDAYEDLVGKEPDVLDEETGELLEAAFTMARKHGFVVTAEAAADAGEADRSDPARDRSG